MKSTVYFFFLALVFNQLNYAQQNIKIEINEAETDVLFGRYTEAISKYKNLTNKIEDNNLKDLSAEVFNNIANIHHKLGDFATAKNYAEKALKLSQDKLFRNKLQEAIAIDNLGKVASYNPELHSALELHKKSLRLKKSIKNIDNLEIVISHIHIAKAYQMQASYDVAQENLNLALKYITKITPKSQILKSKIYEIFGQCNYDQGFKNEALNYYLKSLVFALKVRSDDNTTLDEIYNQIGITYIDKGNNHEALKYLQKALSLNSKKNGENFGQIMIHFNIGSAYTALGIKEKALFHTKKTFNMGKSRFGEDFELMHFPFSQLGKLYGGKEGAEMVEKAINLLKKNPTDRNLLITAFYEMYLAEIYSKQKDYVIAEHHLKKALEIRKTSPDEDSYRVLITMNGLARNYINLGDFDSAYNQIKNSISENLLEENINILNADKFDVSKVKDPHTLIEAILIKIEIELAKYKLNNNLETLRTCYNDSKRLDGIIKKTRNSLRDYGDKFYFTGIVKKAYETHVQLCILMQNRDDKGNYIEEAYLFSEKSKSNILRELVSNPKIKQKVDIDNQLLMKEQDLNNDIVEIRTNLVKETSKIEIDTMKTFGLQENLISLMLKKDSLEQVIETEYPKYYQLKYDNTVVDVAKIQSFLNENTTLVDFLISGNKIYAFIINKNSYHIEQLLIEDLSKKIEIINKSIIIKDQSLFQTTSSQLYEELFKPLRDKIEGANVIIIPDEVLWHLQFDLLINNVDESNKKTPNYLLYDYAFSYANSASFLEETLTSNSTKSGKKDCLAFSYSNKDSENIDNEDGDSERLRNSNIDLPGTRQEVKALSSIIDGTYYYDENASEHNFKTNVADYKITHLALHAEIDSLERDNLKILFSEINNKPNIDDNILYSHELYNMKIPSDLVVLSACNTGTGEVNKGEGIMSIGNAFQYAGAKSLLLSRWEVSDETTPLIIEEFYKNLKAGFSKSEALRQAKITHLENSSILQSQPFYWGSFYVLGSDATIKFSNNFNYLWLLLIGLVLLLIYYFYKKR
ncbi:CHAT domain-containing protein [uncultured Winogradskyella sp.]|uniref:CHAT domain-containing protein n=1 Tax=uncultured Winogradskyella sp. TaxID=395353 RepID=UPI002639C198|nr:CHAT domain-containing protein [uncultured Winogradskyella sp.]